MPTLLRQLLALLAGLIVGSLVNMALITLGPSLIPPPAGVNLEDAESLRRGIHLFEPRHFVAPFLAHALGTLSGALAAWLLAGARRATLAWLVGAFFLCGGIAASLMIPAPAWFIALDLLLAYLPMAWLAPLLGARLMPGSRPPQPSGG